MPFIGEILSSVGCGEEGGREGKRETPDKEEDLPGIMIRPSFPHDLPATGFECATEVGPEW